VFGAAAEVQTLDAMMAEDARSLGATLEARDASPENCSPENLKAFKADLKEKTDGKLTSQAKLDYGNFEKRCQGLSSDGVTSSLGEDEAMSDAVDTMPAQEDTSRMVANAFSALGGAGGFLEEDEGDEAELSLHELDDEEMERYNGGNGAGPEDDGPAALGRSHSHGAKQKLHHKKEVSKFDRMAKKEDKMESAEVETRVARQRERYENHKQDDTMNQSYQGLSGGNVGYGLGSSGGDAMSESGAHPNFGTDGGFPGR
jgi:hypothetical protein